MTEADLMFSRRRFLFTSLKATAGIGAGLILGPDVFDLLDRMGPRRLLVNGAARPMPFDFDSHYRAAAEALARSIDDYFLGLYTSLPSLLGPSTVRLHQPQTATVTLGKWHACRYEVRT